MACVKMQNYVSFGQSHCVWNGNLAYLVKIPLQFERFLFSFYLSDVVVRNTENVNVPKYLY